MFAGTLGPRVFQSLSWRNAYKKVRLRTKCHNLFISRKCRKVSYARRPTEYIRLVVVTSSNFVGAAKWSIDPHAHFSFSQLRSFSCPTQEYD